VPTLGPSIHVLAKNVSNTMPLPAQGRIELAFDRYLLPVSVVRQTFVLRDLRMTVLAPRVSYDPVARVVTITPTSPLQADQTYVLTITAPSGPADPNGLRAIDGATIDPLEATIEFPVRSGDAGIGQAAPPTVDFCKDILPIFRIRCASCHGRSLPAAGLRLDSPQGVNATAFRVAQGANTGPLPASRPPGPVFGVDMPIIDPGSGGSAGGDPGNSWLLYKLLLAVPPQSSMIMARTCDGGAASPTDVHAIHLVQSSTATAEERARLSDYVLGREMPFPDFPADPLGNTTAPLTMDELERVSRWIAQPSSSGSSMVPQTCSCL
jgi:hypothetical protein